MGIIANKSAAAAVEANAVSVAVTPAIIQEIIAFLLSLLSGCVPVASGAGDRIRNLAAGNGRRIDQLMYTRTIRRYAAGYDPEVIEAVIADQMANVTDDEVATMYTEVKK